VLASQSPRRAQLLELLGLQFEIVPADIDETWAAGEDPGTHAERLAREKAAGVARMLGWREVEPQGASPGTATRSTTRPEGSPAAPAGPGAPRDLLVVGSDTVVAIDGTVLGKPTDAADATRMLLSLQGRTHLVATGLAVVGERGLRSALELVRVHFRPLDETSARAYVATGEPLDKAGAYGIQGFGSTLVDRIEGDYFAVMGFPIARFIDLLAVQGWRYTYGGLERGP